MKHTPAIDRALARAKTVGAEADPSALDAWAEDQDCAYALKLYRLEQTLKRRADAFLERDNPTPDSPSHKLTVPTPTLRRMLFL